MMGIEVDDFVETSSQLLQPLEDFFNHVFVMVDSASFDDVLQNDMTHNSLKIYHEIEDTTSSTLAKKDDPADNELQMETTPEHATERGTHASRI
ncbi:hypothetical protein RJ639_013611 [Escallonia herrerae]|uniref:Uncharacterized protein n=1 Tax=Escallonia herrerae TaxID=1293975 RepID=A0AA89AL56_9ASTE|nr:hypothetical protein RJ639_013611 [Escallonia herrerae]